MRATWRPLPAWPHPPSVKQHRRFENDTREGALRLLELEIGRLDGDDVIIGFVGDDSMVNLAGQPKGTLRLAHPGAEVSFEAGGRRIVFHTDAFDWLNSNLYAIARGMEALRTVDRYGITSGGEQYAGFLQLAAGGPDAERGRVLVERAGSLTEALKRHHPDHGGEARDFVDVQAFKKAHAAATR